MNTERILALADIIEKQPHTSMEAEDGFNMINWSHDCGTPSCIAGWAIAMKNNDLGIKLPKAGGEFDPATEAGDYLGISISDGYDLFEPNEDVPWSSITPAQAAATLRHLADTGEVEWGI